MTKLYSRRGISVLLLLFLTHFTHAQKQSPQQRLRANNKVAEFTLNPSLKTPASITFTNAANVPLQQAKTVILELFQLAGKNQLQLVGSTELKGGIKVEKYKQYFQGIKVEHSIYNVISRNGVISAITAEAYDLDGAFKTNPGLPAESAKTKALDFVRATKYAWEAIEEDKRLYPGHPYMQMQLERLKQQYTPKGELVIAQDVYGTKEPRLAYKFEVFAVQPLGHYKIYVDAENGKVLLRDAVIKHADKIKNTSKPDSLRFIPNYQYYNLAQKGQIRYSPPKATASVLGTGLTRYAGVRQIYTKKITVPLGQTVKDPNNPDAVLSYSGVDPRLPVSGDDVYVLIDDTRGGGIETYDCNAVGGVPLSLPQIQATALAFVDRDNNWKDEPDILGLPSREDLIRGNPARDGSNGALEATNDDIAIDAHWGAGIVYDYWKNIHNRLSYDNKNSAIKSYVHYGPAYDNAFWNGSSMTYGDGSGTAVNGGFRPLVSLDVCGHEIGHGVCTFTSDLVYESESGAMNEGFSDIWAAAVERYANISVDPTLAYQYFQIGEQIAADNIGLRRMDNPKSNSNPDTYGGRYWQNPDCVPNLANDQCGVHTNSGVLNKWFYLMVQGPGTTTGSSPYTDDGRADAGTGAGQENLGNNYGALPNFNGIGFDKAEQITYLTELALTPNAKFADARAASIAAAQVLYGVCSQEVITVTNAWFGVNVGAAWAGCTAPVLSVNVLDTAVTEGSGACGAFTEVVLGINLRSGQGTATNVNFTTGGTAEQHDFDLSSSTVTFNAGETGNKTVRLRIYHDDMVEGEETIILNATSNYAGFSFSKTITIMDDDVLPKLGNTFTLLTENFESTPNDQFPMGWDTVNKTSPTGGLWNVRDPQLATTTWTTKRAYIYNPSLPLLNKGVATYDVTVASNVILRTPLIDARGLDSVRLSFLFSAGGETACSPACDYGEVVYSFDGVNFNRFDVDTTSNTTGGNARSASEPLYMTVGDSTFNQLLPQVVSNRQFYLGFRWVNDELVTTQPASITIDNIVVTGQGRKIESDSASTVSTPVRVEPGNPVYFYSEDDKGLLSRITNAGVDLGCVKDTLIQTGNGTVPYAGGRRTRKVHEITPLQNSGGTYTLTLYYTLAELEGFSVPPSQLRILKSNAADIDNSVGANSLVVTPTEVIDSSAQGFYGFTATFNGFSKFAIIEPSLSPLPVNCLDFKASKGADNVSLSWKVSGDAAGVQYELERSEDGSQFTRLSTVAANGAGQYNFTDRGVAGLKGAYYRIKAVERNGAGRYLCTVLFVSFDGRNVFTVSNVYPNPGKNKASVNVTLGSARKLRIEYLNSVGQLVSTQQTQLFAGATRVQLQVQPLAAGTYLLQFKDEEGRIVNTQQFIKH